MLAGESRGSNGGSASTRTAERHCAMMDCIVRERPVAELRAAPTMIPICTRGGGSDTEGTAVPAFFRASSFARTPSSIAECRL